MMKTWLANALLGALHMVCRRLFEHVTDPARAQKKRHAMRERWDNYLDMARRKRCWWRVRAAESLGILFKFKTGPTEAVDRGDINPDNAKPERPELYRIH